MKSYFVFKSIPVFFKMGTAIKFRLTIISKKNAGLASNNLLCLGQEKRQNFNGWPQVTRLAREQSQITSFRTVKNV